MKRLSVALVGLLAFSLPLLAREKVIFDTDMGGDVDDALALAYLLGEPECDLLGVTVEAWGGNGPRQAEIVSALCRDQGRDVEIAIGPGAGNVLGRRAPKKPAKPPRYWPIVHGRDHREFTARNDAVDFIRRTVRANPGEVTILATGQFTNLSALFAVDPELPSLLKRLVVMGGNLDGSSEWNACYDPVATAVVFANGNHARPSETLVVGADVTTPHRLPAAEARRFFAGVQRLELCAEAAEYWLREVHDLYFHDPIAAVAVFHPEIASWTNSTVAVDVLNGRTTFEAKANPEHGSLRVATKIDFGRFNDLFMSVMKRPRTPVHAAQTAAKAPRTFCNPMPVPNMPIGIECWKFNEGDVIRKDKLPPWAYGCWGGGNGDTKIAHQFRELADPEIHVFDGVWYLYPSCGLLWRSRDCGGTWENVDLEAHNPYYAPTVACFRGKYYLTESHVPRGLLVADSPTGPFRQMGRFDAKTFASPEDPAINFGDPMLFADGDRLYIYLGCVAKQGCLWGAELDPENPLKALRPAKRLVWFDKQARPWMGGALEGAYVFKRGETYYFTHAGGSGKTRAYATSVWKGPTPLGPFTPQANNPVFSRAESCAVGGGHGGIFQDVAGDWWTCYTIWPHGAKFHGFERFIGLDRISFDANGDMVSGEPTDEPQWLPSSGKRGPTGWIALPVKTAAKKAADNRLRTYETFADATRMMTFEFEGVRTLRAFRLIWCDLGLDVHRGVKPGPYRYRIDCRVNGKWKTWVDASKNVVDLTVDYREAEEAKTDAVRLVCLAAPKGITPAVTEFTVFGERADAR